MERTFPEIIRAYRQREGLTLAEMSRRCGVSAQYLHSVENGTDTAIGRVDAILRRLGRSLTLGDGEPIEPQSKARRIRKVKG